ncbi:MAG: ABC transporter permease [Chloroflexi bacterium]|nr:ABC transporter permease [Chloroflexota bacterium]
MTNSLARSSEIYDSSRRGNSALEELRGVFQYRDLIFQLIRRDIVARYKRSVLGVAWTMLQPLGMMVVMTLVFSRLFHQIQGYPAYVLSGLITWTFFSQTTTAAIHQMVWGGALLNRIYLPRTSFSISAIGTGLVNLAISIIPLVAIVLVLRLPLTVNILFIPIAMLLLASFALGVGLLLSTLAVNFPDVSEMYQIILMAWMYFTPVIYPETMIPPEYQRWMFTLNPMYHLVKLFRAPIYEGRLPDPQSLLMGTVISLVTLVAGWIVFSRAADRFAYKA